MKPKSRPTRQLPEIGFLRLDQIVRPPNSTEAALLPVCRATFLKMVKKGQAPAPVKYGSSSLWRVEDIKNLIGEIGGDNCRVAHD
ncbi:helix-turn-helix transcriptional regulator [Methylovulum psychrotolerans]|uniref:Uncharacterized protein n=1 Tax=Methylovulum psychrotolerans TaxID=1704499 RepID=A0A2S5CQ88_9GAMM|nr:transcriptional regulator [Methylovulum psychrotolerans]POZ52980.1 hypothetical protein AADEFJLK_01596 [Methylovulum psychrotolerans]